MSLCTGRKCGLLLWRNRKCCCAQSMFWTWQLLMKCWKTSTGCLCWLCLPLLPPSARCQHSNRKLHDHLSLMQPVWKYFKHINIYMWCLFCQSGKAHFFVCLCFLSFSVLISLSRCSFQTVVNSFLLTVKFIWTVFSDQLFYRVKLYNLSPEQQIYKSSKQAA